MLIQQFSGVNAVIFNSSSILKSAGIKDSNTGSLYVGGVQIVVTMVAVLFVDRLGRRPLMLLASTGMVASLILLGYYYFMEEHVSTHIALYSVIGYIAFFSIGLGAVPWLMMSEIFPTKVRGLAASVATLINWAFAFTVTETFKSMEKSSIHKQVRARSRAALSARVPPCVNCEQWCLYSLSRTHTHTHTHTWWYRVCSGSMVRLPLSAWS